MNPTKLHYMGSFWFNFVVQWNKPFLFDKLFFVQVFTPEVLFFALKYEKMQIQLNWSSKSTFVPHVKWCCWIYQVLHLSLQMVEKMFSFGILWKFFPIAVFSKDCFMRWVFSMAEPPFLICAPTKRHRVSCKSQHY